MSFTKQRLVYTAILAGLFSIGTGCSDQPTGGSTTGQSGRSTIVCTCGMVTSIVREVVGDLHDISYLMGETVDPHLYTPRRNDVAQLLNADMVFYSGLLLEGRMSDTFTQVGRRGIPVFAVTEALDPSQLREPAEFQGHYDPHVWMNVALWSECAKYVSEVMSKFDPAHADEYRTNYEQYATKLKQLDTYVRDVIATIPEPQRVLVTAHDAFGYFSEAYDIPVRSVQGLSTESEAGVEDVRRLVAFITEKGIPAIFVESSVSERNIEAIVEGVRAKGGEVRIGGELFSDAMGSEGTYEGTYVGMIDHNATVIARALGGEAPPGGFQGRLATEQSGN